MVSNILLNIYVSGKIIEIILKNQFLSSEDIGELKECVFSVNEQNKCSNIGYVFNWK